MAHVIEKSRLLIAASLGSDNSPKPSYFSIELVASFLTGLLVVTDTALNNPSFKLYLFSSHSGKEKRSQFETFLSLVGVRQLVVEDPLIYLGFSLQLGLLLAKLNRVVILSHELYEY